MGKRLKVHGKMFPLLAMLFVTLIAFFFVWTRVQNISLNRELTRLHAQEKKVDLENKKLRIEWAKLVNPARLRKIAKEKFQLKEASPRQILVIQEDYE